MFCCREFVCVGNFFILKPVKINGSDSLTPLVPMSGFLTPPVLSQKTKVSSHGFPSLKNSVPQILLFYYLCIYLFAFILKIKPGLCPMWSCWTVHLKDILSSIMPHPSAPLDRHVLLLSPKAKTCPVHSSYVTAPDAFPGTPPWGRSCVYSLHTHCSWPLSFPELLLICTCMSVYTFHLCLSLQCMNSRKEGTMPSF